MLKSGDLHGVQEKEFAQEMKKKQSLHKSGVQFENTDIEAVPSKLSVPLPFFIQHFHLELRLALPDIFLWLLAQTMSLLTCDETISL